MPALGCLIEAERIAEVGSPVIGVVERVEVERGERVNKGQVLAVLRDSVERAALSVATLRARSDADIQAATASAEFNRKKLERTRDLVNKKFVSQQALEQARAEAELADQKLVQVREQRDLARQERDVAAAQLEQRTIRSPIDGVVAERYVSPGERVDEKPLLRIAKVDPLRVQLVVPVAMYSRVQMGGGASVSPEFPGAPVATALVTMIDKVVDPASNTFRVHLQMPNQGGALPPGLRCKAEFGTAQAPVPTAPPPATTAPFLNPASAAPTEITLPLVRVTGTARRTAPSLAAPAEARAKPEAAPAIPIANPTANPTANPNAKRTLAQQGRVTEP
jgi:RND family efflux transporter MFP subunit